MVIRVKNSDTNSMLKGVKVTENVEDQFGTCNIAHPDVAHDQDIKS